MGFLKKLFGGGGGGGFGNDDPHGIYFYVRPDRCEEVVRVRIDSRNDLSLEDSGSGYFVRKTVRGSKCFNTVEMTLHFDGNRKFSNADMTGGELVDADAYAAWTASQKPPAEE